MPVLVSGAEGTVYIDELVGDVGFGVPGNAGGGGAVDDAVAGRGVVDDEGEAATTTTRWTTEYADFGQQSIWGHQRRPTPELVFTVAEWDDDSEA